VALRDCLVFTPILASRGRKGASQDQRKESDFESLREASLDFRACRDSEGLRGGGGKGLRSARAKR